MVFSSIPFLYYFLPISLTIYYLSPKKYQNFILLVFSLFFYAWGEPKYIFLMLATITLFFILGLKLEKTKTQRGKKKVLVSAVVLGILFLGIFKYTDFMLDTVNAVFGSNIPLTKIALPIGISFYLFQCISYIVDVYRGDAPAQKSFVRFGAYVSMFPQLIAGPIVRYGSINKELENREITIADVQDGISRFLIGLGKKVLIADNFGKLIEICNTANEKSVILMWMYAFAVTLQIYFDFSGYSDMAIGLGRMLGFHFSENFQYPYTTKSVTEFWRKWHMSLGSWFRDYVYIPMGGNRVSNGKWIINILTVWMLTGLWHGAAWNFVIWGLFFGVLLLIEKKTGFASHLPTGFAHIYVMIAVIFSFVIFQAPTLQSGWNVIVSLLGLGNIPFTNTFTGYTIKSFAILFLIACIGATPYPAKIGNKLKRSHFGLFLHTLFLIALLLLCSAYLVDESFHPFLYFRF